MKYDLLETCTHSSKIFMKRVTCNCMVRSRPGTWLDSLTPQDKHIFPLWATKTKLPSSLDFYPYSAPARARMITGTLMSLNVMEENERREEKRCNVPLMSFLHAPHLLSFSLISVSFSSGQSISASLFSSLSLMSILNLYSFLAIFTFQKDLKKQPQLSSPG